MSNIVESPTKPLENLPHTIEGLLERSDPRIAKRDGECDNRVEELRAETEGARSMLEASMAGEQAATAHRLQQEQRQRDNPAHDLSAEADKALETERRAKNLTAKGREKLAAMQARLFPAVELQGARKRLLASLKTSTALTFHESAMYSADVADPHAERAARQALLGLKVRERSTVENAHKSAEAVERTLLGQLDRKAEAGEIAISGLTGKTLPTFSLPLKSFRAQPAPYAGHAFSIIPDLESLACRHWHDELASEIRAKVAEAYQGVPAEMVLDADERRKRLRALDAEIDKLQREVADLTWMLVEDGHECDFPADIPARAVLGIA